MSSRVRQLGEISKLLDEGKIDRFEYEALKEELLTSQTPPVAQSSAGESSELMELAWEEIMRLRGRTLAEFNWTPERLRLTAGGQVLLQGIDAFDKGVGAFTLKAIGPNSDLMSLIELKPALLPMAVYMGVTGAIDDITSRYANSASPIEFRGYMAAFALLAWQSLTSAEIPLDPGLRNRPDQIFVRLGVADERDSSEVGHRDEVEPMHSAQGVPSLAEVVGRVHRKMGLVGLPVSLGVSIVEAVDGMLAAGLLHRTDSLDGFKQIIIHLQRGLTTQQRKQLGYSSLNSYPSTAVAYAKEIILQGIAAGAVDYSSEIADLIRSKPAGR